MPVALVTGSASRLGMVIASHLAENGYSLILHVNKSRVEGKKLQKSITAAGHKASLVFCDFGKPSGVPGFIEGVFERHGTPDLIINNASAFEYDFPGRGSAEILDKSLAIHVKTPALLLEFANRKASSKRPITVVNILDQKVVNLNPDYYSYTVGKSAMFAITRMWQMAPSSKLRVFGILPGLLFPSGKQTEHDFERVRNDTLLNRNPTPQEIANAILFVARTPSMPGQNLTIDGGESLVRRARDIAYE